MKKALVLALSVVLALGLVVPVLAATEDDAVVKAYTQRLEAQKQYFDALAEAGRITEAQADLAKKNIDIRIEFINSPDFDSSTYFGAPNNTWGPRGRFGGRMMGGFGGRMMGGFGGGYCGACAWGYAPAPVPAPAQ